MLRIKFRNGLIKLVLSLGSMSGPVLLVACGVTDDCASGEYCIPNCTGSTCHDQGGGTCLNCSCQKPIAIGDGPCVSWQQQPGSSGYIIDNCVFGQSCGCDSNSPNYYCVVASGCTLSGGSVLSIIAAVGVFLYGFSHTPLYTWIMSKLGLEPQQLKTVAGDDMIKAMAGMDKDDALLGPAENIVLDGLLMQAKANNVSAADLQASWQQTKNIDGSVNITVQLADGTNQELTFRSASSIERLSQSAAELQNSMDNFGTVSYRDGSGAIATPSAAVAQVVTQTLNPDNPPSVASAVVQPDAQASLTQVMESFPQCCDDITYVTGTEKSMFDFNAGSFSAQRLMHQVVDMMVVQKGEPFDPTNVELLNGYLADANRFLIDYGYLPESAEAPTVDNPAQSQRWVFAPTPNNGSPAVVASGAKQFAAAPLELQAYGAWHSNQLDLFNAAIINGEAPSARFTAESQDNAVEAANNARGDWDMSSKPLFANE